MSIRINYFAKLEGSAGAAADILNSDVKSVKMQMQKSSRFIEGIMIGRHYKDMPVIAERICGICSTVHNLASIKAVENAMGIQVSDETAKLRKVLINAQIIYSHALHLFFMSLTDSLNIENNLLSVKEYPPETEEMLRVRKYSIDLMKIIGGRTIHPINNEIGGFKKVPSQNEIKELIIKGEEIIPTALKLSKFFQDFKVPNFSRPTEYVCLSGKGGYAFYEGDVISNKGLHVSEENIREKFHEFHRPKEIAKRIERDGKTSYMTGAIARINNNSSKLSVNAKKYLESLNFNAPDYNIFHNVHYQLAEIIHCIEESVKLLKEVAHSDISQALIKEYKIAEGSAAAAIESPQGTLYYWVDIDAKGYIKNVNIITPTAQFLTHLEDDMASFLSGFSGNEDKNKENKTRALIRAYDPCLTCVMR